jgi:AcrR family transcriptional regulator
MSQQGLDRRSQRTQQALMDALIALLSIKHYDSISIQDIVEKANVGRSTFYAHFQTKDDLLIMGFARVLDMLLGFVVLSETNNHLELDTTALFQHASGHYELYKTLTWGSGLDILTRDGHNTFSSKIQERLTQFTAGKEISSVSLSILSYHLAGSLLLLLKWWLDNKMPNTPEEMNSIVQQLVMPGIRSTLGFSG